MKKCAVIVGSGVAGAIVATALLERSQTERVVMLEAGTVVSQMDRRAWLDYLTTWRLPYDPNRDLRSDYELSAEALAFEGGRLFVRGGSTMHWGGWALRYKPEDFHSWTQAGREIDWPYGYDDLEHYYWLAEQLLGVSGPSDDDNPPRYGRPYRYGAPPMVAADDVVRNSLERLGMRYSHFPIARFADRCVTTGTCRYCPVGGRYSATQTLDSLERTYGSSGRFVIKTGASVHRIELGSSHTATGIAYTEKSSDDVRVLEADLVVLCAGAIETPKILLASTSSRWPEGLGNHSGHVGRHFKIHPMLYVDAKLDQNPKKVLQELDFPTLACRHFDTPEEQRDGKLFFSRTSRFPQLDIEKMMADGASNSQIEHAVSGPVTVTLSGFIEEFSTDRSRVGLAQGRTQFGVARTALSYAPMYNADAIQRHLTRMSRVLENAGARVLKKGLYERRIDHTASTTRMSADPGHGVIDQDLRVHGTDNVYVCSTAAFPNISAVPPTLTLAAVALKLGDHLTGKAAPSLPHSEAL
ncbi:GMC family oxidoreductase [Dyella jiangningensis]|uniref:GMC oxidoreductase n=1 Tax=Dyella jiangningensis TaxID=1379159 RepID=UPI00240F72CC|nr:GMC family oxidoreductase [Dyella jiangningensis]MDG2539215.1 GMC family oxidoreductase [Dyella jiangningensis]